MNERPYSLKAAAQLIEEDRIVKMEQFSEGVWIAFRYSLHQSREVTRSAGHGNLRAFQQRWDGELSLSSSTEQRYTGDWGRVVPKDEIDQSHEHVNKAEL